MEPSRRSLPDAFKPAFNLRAMLRTKVDLALICGPRKGKGHPPGWRVIAIKLFRAALPTTNLRGTKQLHHRLGNLLLKAYAHVDPLTERSLVLLKVAEL